MRASGTYFRPELPGHFKANHDLRQSEVNIVVIAARFWSGAQKITRGPKLGRPGEVSLKRGSKRQFGSICHDGANDQAEDGAGGDRG